MKILAWVPISVEGDDNVSVLVHEGILFTLLLNICRNASVHGNASKVSIKVSRWRIEVLDDGKGIPDEVAARMFELGFTTGHGKGIGLGDAQKRMQVMGGDISCETHGGLEGRYGCRGAKFILTLRKAPAKRKSKTS